MSGYMFCMGSCVACKRPITFNPNKVPSIRVNGQREPLCADCFDRWNKLHRTSKGLAPIPINPDAYEPEPA